MRPISQAIFVLAVLIGALAALGLAGVALADQTVDIQIIGSTNKCGASTPAANGDGDGDSQVDDFQYDIKEGAGKALAKDNGTLELWCINRKYFALLFQPAAGGGFRFIAKCPWIGGINTPVRYTLNDAGNNFLGTEWVSTDNGPPPASRDDDGDTKKDRWRYTYDVATDMVTEEHREDGVVQGDGAAAHAPAVRDLTTTPKKEFTFGDLRPLNPTNDDPTAGPELDPCEDDDGAEGSCCVISVGGVGEFYDDGAVGGAESASGGSGSASAVYAALAGGLTVGALALGTGGWYAMRRWLR